MPTRHRRPGSIAEVRRPSFAREAFQVTDNFINDRITDLRQFEAGDSLERVSDRQHLQGKHV
jgi:hypothetical protein